MASWRLWMLCLAALLVLEGHCGLNIEGCESGSVDIVENTSPSFTCGTFWSNWLEWHAFNDYGDEKRTFYIGFCDTERCEFQNNKFKLGLESSNGYKSVLKISDIKRDTAFRIICKHQLTSVQCRLRIIGLKISNCVNGDVDVVEDTSPSFTCGTFSRSSLVWLTGELKMFRMGACDENSCTSDNIMYKLRLESSSSADYSSELTITKIDRNSSRHLLCVNYAAVTWCSLRIFAPARIVPGDCSVTISNWRVQGSCQVENMFMLNDNYTCTWRENSARITGDFHGQQKYYNNLNREYWKAVCSFSKVMPVDQKEFTYRIEISPGSQDFFVEIINILPPNKPEYNCTDNVTEGSNVTCICTSLNMGNPPANLSWDGKTDGILLLQDVQRENDNSKYTCRLTWGPNGFINHTIVYTLRVVGKEQTSAANVKAWMIGGIVAAVMLITIIGTLITIFIVKRQKGTICKGKINLRFWPCASYFCHRKKRLSQSRDVVNSSQTPIIRHAAPSGDLYTVVMTTTSGQVEDEYVTLSQTTENTEIDKVCNPQESQDMAQMTESRTRPTLQSQRTTAWGRNFSDLTGTCYMNVTEVPTDSGLGVYHIVPWAVVPTQHQPDTGVYSEAVISEEEYNVLQFQEDRTRQEDHADIYHRIQHS